MYGTVPGWIAYASARGLVVANDPASAAALTRASDYIRTRYVVRFSGAYDETMPEVEEAAYIAASYELATPGFWSATFTPSDVKTLTAVGGIRWTPVQLNGMSGSDAMTPISPAIDALLAPLTRWGMPAVMTV